MKKTIALILVCVMALTAFAACGEKDITGTITEPETNNTPAVVTKPDAEGKTQDPEPEVATAPEPEIELGVTGGGSYTNEFAEINFALPNSWTFADQQQLMELMNIASAEMLSDDNRALVEYAMEGTFYDMIASGPSGENVMVMFENISRYVGGTFISEDAYIDILERNFALVEGLTYVVVAKGTATIGGIEYKTLNATIEGSILQQYAVHRVGKYMVCIALTGFDEASVEAMYGYFS